MNEELIKRYSLAEIALLLIFVIGLILASLIVKVRHRIVLSDPIPLAGSGLAVSMPTNAGWEYETAWRYESDNKMVLVAQQAIGRNQLVSAQWHYDICSPDESARQILEQIISESGSTIDFVETIKAPVAMEYAVAYPPDSDAPFYLGVAKLDYGRHLELHLIASQAIDLAFTGEALFQSLVDGIRYEPPRALATGRQQVATFWDSLGTNKIDPGSKPDASFLIKTANNRPYGYRIEHFGGVGTSDQAPLLITSRKYEFRTSRTDSTFLFDTRNGFKWDTTVHKAGMGRPQEFTLVQGTDGWVSLTTNFDENRRFKAARLLLPELLLPEFAAFFLQGDRQRVVVDVIAHEGFVVPAIIETMAPDDGLLKSEQFESVVKIDFIHHSKSFEELYFDKNKRFIARFDRQPLRQYIWEYASPEQLEQIFEENYRPLNNNVAALR